MPITQAAAELGVSRATLDRLALAGKLRRFRRPGDRRVHVSMQEARQAVEWREE